MLTQTLKRVKLKGRIVPVIREQYLRDDIPCYSPICQSCVIDSKVLKPVQLEKSAIHYAIPCIDIILNYLEILELQEIKGLIIVQSIISKILLSHGHRMYNRLRAICKDIRRSSIVFLNEISYKASVVRDINDSFDQWLVKCCINTAEFYSDHLNGVIPIILITENVEAYKPLITEKRVYVCSLKEYLETTCCDSDSIIQLYESLTFALSTGSIKDLSKSYDAYLPMDVLEAGIKAGRYLRGYLRVNKHNAQQEAFVTSSKAFVKDCGDVFISGMIDRNRAVHGDEIVVEVLPRDQWKSRCFRLLDNPYDDKDGEESGESPSLPTGRVVGVLERCWRNYVATLPEEEDSNLSVKNRERILVIPYDYRIPKIRIATKQADNIRNQRIVVRIDSWDKDSQYPNGHLVEALGEIGDLETEVRTLLIEHGVFSKEFPQNLNSELPTCSVEHPWTVEEGEISKRRDLRKTHLVFSIDPKGCEDVDDTLSVRTLPKGMLELGVHIADVTYFVKDASLVDLEARSRSTSVYLPDRRYDMLPHVLSSNVCSLLSNVDRYAMSVMWELDSECQVQNVWYGRTIINSSYKLCYEAAQDILLGVGAEEMVPEIPELQELCKSDLNTRFLELKTSLSQLYHIANVIRRNRLSEGGLELNSVDMKFEIDRSLPSIVTDIKSTKELAVHKTIAECMIFANHWVAKKINDTFPHHAVLRRHPNPREADLKELQKLALTRGLTLDTSSNRDLAASLERAQDPQDPTVNQIFRILATHTMNQATYCCTGNVSSAELYHYGLGLNRYTHFTSPIRRYADVLVHRLLLAAIENSETDVHMDSTEMDEMCNHMNIKHKAAQDLEKDAQQLFLVFFFEDHISKETCLFSDAIIYSIRSNGMLVFVPRYGLKSAVRLCDAEKRVAMVTEDNVSWLEGKLVRSENNLIVTAANGLSHTYSIFSHITVCIRVQSSRSHHQKIVLDLVNNKPYTADWTTISNEPLDLLSGDTKETKVTEKHSQSKRKSSVNKKEEFNLYLFLQNFRDLTLADKPN